MTKKLIYSFGLFLIISLLFYFYTHRSQTADHSLAGTVGLAARENKLLPLRAVQAFVNYRVATEHITLADELLPDSLKKDPWGTPYECNCKDERFYLHSAGPDKIMINRPLKPCDDIIILKFCVVDLSTPLSDLNDMMNRFSEPLIAETLLNCDDASYRDGARDWLEAHGYKATYPGSLNPEVW